jgi:hypothetical protein
MTAPAVGSHWYARLGVFDALALELGDSGKGWSNEFGDIVARNVAAEIEEPQRDAALEV